MGQRLAIGIAALLVLAANAIAQGTGSLVPASGPPQVDLMKWRLSLTGEGLGHPATVTYEELLQLHTATKREPLECPGLFAYSVECEGVPLSILLEKGEVRDEYSKITFVALDRYTIFFTREEVGSHLLFLALKVNGKPLPPADGRGMPQVLTRTRRRTPWRFAPGAS